MATLLYGCGLRLLECCRLRVKDVDFGRNQITIRRGKGDKDRATMLPVSIKSELAVHLERVRTQHERDLANGAGWVELPVLSRPALDVDARGGEDPGFGDNTLLGRLEMIGDRLVLEVNSAGRLARARQWLEGLPGVSFERATARDVLSESRPVDDKLPARPVRSSRRCCARSSRCTATSFEVGWISRSPLSVVSPRARRARHRKAGVGWNGWCARCRPPRTREERSRLCATSSCASSG